MVLCLVGLYLRVVGLGDLSLWTDEAFTWGNAHEPLARLLGGGVNVHPPLYFLIERYWIRMVGETEYALRLSSALGSVVAVAALWQLGRRLGGWPAGLAAAALVTFAPIALGYAREARMYGLLIAEVAALLAAAERVRARPAAGRWALYGGLALAAGLTHYTGVAAVAAAAVWTATAGRRRAVPWLTVHASVLLVLGAWGLRFWSSREAWAGLVWQPWAGPVGLDQQTIDWMSSLAGLPLGPVQLAQAVAADSDRRLMLALALPLFVAAAVGAISLARRRTAVSLALLLLAAGPLGAIVLLEPIRPMWHVRFTLVGLPAVYLLAGLGVGAAWRRNAWLGLSLVPVVVGPQLYGLLTAPPDQRENWQAVARELRPRLTANDVVLGALELTWRYYLGGPAQVRQRPIPLRSSPEATADALNGAVGGARVVWLVPAEDPLMDPGDLVPALLERYAVGRERLTVAGVNVVRLELRPRDRIAASPAMKPVAALYGGAIRLQQYLAERRRLGDEWSVQVSIDVRPERPIDGDYKLFAHLLDAGGQTVAQRDIFPLDPERRPTGRWDVGQPVRLEVIINGSAGQIGAGRSVGVGFYAEGSGARLPLEPAAPEHRLLLPVDGTG